MSRLPSFALPFCLVVLVTLSFSLEAQGQSLLQRTPNLSGSWVGPPGQLQMSIVHRFRVTSGEVRVVSVSPTLFAGVRLPGAVFAGLNYSSSSIVSPRTPNELELLARRQFLSSGDGAPLDLGVQAGYNTAGRSVDAELSVAGEVGRVRLLTAARVFSSPYDGDEARGAVAGGVVIRLGARSALVGDVGGLLDLDREAGERIAWSAGLHVQVPVSPHTLSIHVSNAVTTTLEGSALGSNRTRYGFEFTVPLTLSRIFGFGLLPERNSVAAGGMRVIP